MKEQHILVIDQSTSGTKVLLVDDKAQIVYKNQKSHQQYYPKPGWVEHDPIEIYQNVIALVSDCLKCNSFKNVTLAITNQRETVLLWDKETGCPIYNAIVWQCRRTADYCMNLVNERNDIIVQSKTGLKIDPYFSASKLNWLLGNVPEAKSLATQGRLMAGTIDTWLIWNLTDRKVFKTDVTNASRTLLYNIYDLRWDETLIELFGLGDLLLPKVCKCNDHFGSTTFNSLSESEVEIHGVIGDSQGALFAQKCYDIGMAKVTYGTGTSILMNTGNQPVKSKMGLVTAIAWALNDQVEYALEGIINCSGDIISWLKSNIHLFESYDQLEELATSITDNEGVYFVPALVGYGIPYWKTNAKAALVGMTRATKKANILRAGLEAIVYQVYDAIQIMEEAAGIKIKCLKADGGATTNQFLMQFQSDILKKEVVSSDIKELSAMGAVYIAGLKVGVWQSVENLNQSAKEFKPHMADEMYTKNINGWKMAVELIVS